MSWLAVAPRSTNRSTIWMRNWSNFWPEMGQISKWSKHFVKRSAISSGMGVLAIFSV